MSEPTCQHGKREAHPRWHHDLLIARGAMLADPPEICVCGSVEQYDWLVSQGVDPAVLVVPMLGFGGSSPTSVTFDEVHDAPHAPQREGSGAVVVPAHHREAAVSSDTPGRAFLDIRVDRLDRTVSAKRVPGSSSAGGAPAL